MKDSAGTTSQVEAVSESSAALTLQHHESTTAMVRSHRCFQQQVKAARVTNQDRPKTRNARRIVLVDDNVLFRQAVSRVLSSAGFEVHSASTIDHGLTLCEVMMPGVLISDYNLSFSGPTGFDLADTVRASMGELAPRIIIVSGSSVLPTERGGIEVIMIKALDTHGLVEAVKGLCGETDEVGKMSTARKKTRISTDRMKAVHQEFRGEVTSIDRQLRSNRRK